MNIKMLITALTVTVVTLAACAPGGGQGTPSLESTQWVLQTLDGQPLLAGTVLTVEFSKGESRGSAGCNQYFGAYEMAGGALTIRPVGMTEMYCMEPAGVMEQEQAFLSALAAVAGYRLASDRLEMLDADGDVVLAFVPPAPAPEVTLEGTIWALTTFVEGETATSLIAGTAITLQFEDGQARGSAGCNDYGGPYTLARGTLSIPEISITEQLCVQPEGLMEQEARYVDFLRNVTIFELDADQLTLRTADGRGLVFTTHSPHGL